MRVAIVHDWLYVFGGAERVLTSILKCFPDADIYTLFDVLDDANKAKIGYSKSNVSFMQRMPLIRKAHRLYLPLMAIAVEQFDLSSYDVVISSSASLSKGVITGPDQLHISYVHSPMRYAWDMQHEYLRQGKKDKGLSGIIARYVLHKMRLWDVRTAHGPDALVANSRYIARRIRKAYGRKAEVIYPPVRIPEQLSVPKKNYFLAASRLVAYKNNHLIAEAFTKYLPNEQLVICGDGPELAKIKSMAGPNVSFTGFVSDAELAIKMAEAQAFIFAAEDDFGIVPVEAQSHGTPVIALGRGGACETVIAGGDRPTGVFFPEAKATLIAAAVHKFRSNQTLYNPDNCRRNALYFSEDRFTRQFKEYVLQCYGELQEMRLSNEDRNDGGQQ
jgi:glycosyltransferase involved in cell wall biosynthesis